MPITEEEEKAEEYVITNICKSCGLCEKGDYSRCDEYRDGKKIYLDGFTECRKGTAIADELKRFFALWEQTVCEIRAENKASSNNTQIAHLCDKLESSMVAYARGNIEYAHFVI